MFKVVGGFLCFPIWWFQQSLWSFLGIPYRWWWPYWYDWFANFVYSSFPKPVCKLGAWYYYEYISPID
jgi:hypothetical protein